MADGNRGLQNYIYWFLSVRRHVRRLSGQSAKNIAGYEFYRDMHLDGFRPDQVAAEAIHLFNKEANDGASNG